MSKVFKKAMELQQEKIERLEEELKNQSTTTCRICKDENASIYASRWEVSIRCRNCDSKYNLEPSKHVRASAEKYREERDAEQ